MNDNAETPPKPPAKPALFLNADEEKQALEIGVDTDGDGKADFTKTVPIKDPRVWAAIGWIIAGISVAKNLGIW